MKSKAARCGLIGTLLGLAGSVVAAPGDLDSTFGSGGRVSLDLGDQPTFDYSLIQQADGRLVLAGSVYDNGYAQRMLARFEANGSLDEGFGRGGIAIGQEPHVEIAALIQQADGKLVVAGGDGQDAALWRLDSNGDVDASFGADGVVTLDLGGLEWASQLVQQSDRKLVIAGISETDADRRLFLARFTPAGNPDETFGDGGSTIVDVAGDFVIETTALMLDPEWRVLAAFHQRSGVTVVRITTSGAIDETFGNGGIAEVAAVDMDQTHTSTRGGSAALMDDGRVVVVGVVGHSTCCDPWGDPIIFSDGFVIRLQPDGAIDPTLGTHGILTSEDEFAAVGVESNGKIVVAFDDLYRMGIVRFEPDGSIDDGFGIEGKSIADFASEGEFNLYIAEAIIRQSDGKWVVVAGRAVANGPGWNPAIARFTAGDAGFAGLIGFTIVESFTDESLESAVLTVRRSGGTAGAVSVVFETIEGSATAGTDYISQLGRIEWADGDATDQTITLTLVDDANHEPAPPEQFVVRLSDATGGAMLAASDATISIGDDDAAPPRPPPTPTANTGGGGSFGLSFLLLLGLAGFVASSFSHRSPLRTTRKTSSR